MARLELERCSHRYLVLQSHVIKREQAGLSALSLSVDFCTMCCVVAFGPLENRLSTACRRTQRHVVGQPLPCYAPPEAFTTCSFSILAPTFITFQTISSASHEFQS
jgi:hypothetical protein